MKFNFAQALAILAVANPIAALQSPDYTDKLAVAARDITPEAAPALPVDEMAPIQARDPLRRPFSRKPAARKPAARQPASSSGGGAQPRRSRTGGLRNLVDASAGLTDIARNIHGMRQSSQFVDQAPVEEPVTKRNVEQEQSLQEQTAVQKRDLEARDPARRRRGGGSRRPSRGGSEKAVHAVNIGAGATDIIRNAHTIHQNSLPQ